MTEMSRRAALAGLAAIAPATAVAAMPEVPGIKPDPIFAALDLERERFDASELKAKMVEEKYEKVHGPQARGPQAKLRASLGIKDWLVYREIEEELFVPAYDAWGDAQDDLLKTQPTTMAGLLAFVRYLRLEQAEDLLPNDWQTVALDTIASSIRAMA